MEIRSENNDFFEDVEAYKKKNLLDEKGKKIMDNLGFTPLKTYQIDETEIKGIVESLFGYIKKTFTEKERDALVNDEIVMKKVFTKEGKLKVKQIWYKDGMRNTHIYKKTILNQALKQRLMKELEEYTTYELDNIDMRRISDDIPF